MKKITVFQEVGLSNPFLFAVSMSDAETCKDVLECILGMKISEVHVRTEENICLNPEYRGIRLDVIADDENHTQYNIEMQTVNEGNLPKRGRFYQAEMDVTYLLPGHDFNELPNSYVIFICTFDPFKKDLYKYTYTYRCHENGSDLGDGTTRIYLNTKGKNREDVPKALVDFLGFVEDTTEEFADKTEQEFLRRIYDRIAVIKSSRRMEGNYMLFEELLLYREREGKREGKREGRREGQQLMLKLIDLMLADYSYEDIKRLSYDDIFLEEMLKKYHLQ